MCCVRPAAGLLADHPHVQLQHAGVGLLGAGLVQHRQPQRLGLVVRPRASVNTRIMYDDKFSVRTVSSCLLPAATARQMNISVISDSTNNISRYFRWKILHASNNDWKSFMFHRKSVIPSKSEQKTGNSDSDLLYCVFSKWCGLWRLEFGGGGAAGVECTQVEQSISGTACQHQVSESILFP